MGKSFVLIKKSKSEEGQKVHYYYSTITRNLQNNLHNVFETSLAGIFKRLDRQKSPLGARLDTAVVDGTADYF